MSARVLAFEAWDSGSHRAVRESIQRHGTLDWRFLTLPGRSPKWRLRHGALELARRARNWTNEGRGGGPGFHPRDADLVFTTGMLSASDLIANLPRPLRSRPLVLSMHENQAAYPIGPDVPKEIRQRDAHLAFTNLSSVGAADRVIWNSRWNLESFIEGMRSILSHAPEPIDDRWSHRLRDRSIVVPPPIEAEEIELARVLRNTPAAVYPDGRPRDRRKTLVAWPHRWEHDKGCDELLAIADEAAKREAAGGPAIRWVILGHQPPRPPEAMTTLLMRHRPRILHAGECSRSEYLGWLTASDWVLSTARHEFFGMAVAEALLAGCRPWLPSRLAYPELVPNDGLGLTPWSAPDDVDLDQLGRRIQDMLERARAEIAVAAVEAVVKETIAEAPTDG